MLEGLWTGAGRLTIIALAALLILISQAAPGKAISADPASKSMVNCDIQQGPCTQDLGYATVTLDVLPKPVKAMKDLRFRVTVSGGKLVKPTFVDLGMPGMDMGPNRVELKPVRDNVYEGQGIIVRCPSGRRTWKATVTLPEAGRVEFLFDVID